MGGINCLFTIIPHGEGVNESKLLARSSGPGNLLEMILQGNEKSFCSHTHACVITYLSEETRVMSLLLSLRNFAATDRHVIQDRRGV